MRSNRTPVSAVILTYNEVSNIRFCLDSISGFCEIYIVDSGSADGTIEICREYTNHIYTNPYTNHSNQWYWALDNLPIQTEWILALDADFTVTPELKKRMATELVDLPGHICGIYVRHLYVFAGSMIRFGGTKQFWLRIIRRNHAKPDLSDLVDFRFVIDGNVTRWREAVIEYNHRDDDISIWLRKQDKFSLRLAVEEEMRRAGQHDWQLQPRLFGRTDERFAWLRDRWLNLPLFLRPVLYFIYRYFLAGGFLDGRGGFLYHVLQGFWLRLVVDWKIAQLRQYKPGPTDLQIMSQLMLDNRDGSINELCMRWKAASSKIHKSIAAPVGNHSTRSR